MVATCNAVNFLRIITVNLDCPRFLIWGNKLAKLLSFILSPLF